MTIASKTCNSESDTTVQAQLTNVWTVVQERLDLSNLTEPTEEVANTTSYPRLQVSSTIHGDFWVVRGESGKDFDETLQGLGEHADSILSSFSNFKSAAVAKGVFTGQANPSASAPAATRAASGPPASNGTPQCAHGEMKDLADKGYRHRYYCPQPRGQKQCPPQD